MISSRSERDKHREVISPTSMNICPFLDIVELERLVRLFAGRLQFVLLGLVKLYSEKKSK